MFFEIDSSKFKILKNRILVEKYEKLDVEKDSKAIERLEKALNKISWFKSNDKKLTLEALEKVIYKVKNKYKTKMHIECRDKQDTYMYGRGNWFISIFTKDGLLSTFYANSLFELQAKFIIICYIYYEYEREGKNVK